MLSRGLEELEVIHSKGTPVETALPTETDPRSTSALRSTRPAPTTSRSTWSPPRPAKRSSRSPSASGASTRRSRSATDAVGAPCWARARHSSRTGDRATAWSTSAGLGEPLLFRPRAVTTPIHRIALTCVASARLDVTDVPRSELAVVVLRAPLDPVRRLEGRRLWIGVVLVLDMDRAVRLALQQVSTVRRRVD